MEKGSSLKLPQPILIPSTEQSPNKGGVHDYAADSRRRGQWVWPTLAILNTLALGLRLPFGRLLAHFFTQWQIAVWVLVINFIIIPLLFIGYVLTIASSIPSEIKVGFCVAALCAGMPFAPLLARVARADVATATRACLHFYNQIRMAAMVTIARKLTASFSYRVATRRNCLSRLMQRSTWLRSR